MDQILIIRMSNSTLIRISAEHRTDLKIKKQKVNFKYQKYF